MTDKMVMLFGVEVFIETCFFRTLVNFPRVAFDVLSQLCQVKYLSSPINSAHIAGLPHIQNQIFRSIQKSMTRAGFFGGFLFIKT